VGIRHAECICNIQYVRKRSCAHAGIGSVPGTPAAISTLGGAATVCPSDVKTYFVAKVAGVNSYLWYTNSIAARCLINVRALLLIVLMLLITVIFPRLPLQLRPSMPVVNSSARSLSHYKNLQFVFLSDADGDGYGNASVSVFQCAAPAVML